MFRLIALVVFLLNGEPTGEPTKFFYQNAFETVAACEVQRDSQENTDAVAKLVLTLNQDPTRLLPDNPPPDGAVVQLPVKQECAADDDDSPAADDTDDK